MFITDFDGTLLTDHKTIRSGDLETLASLRAEHTLTAIATGRSLFSFNRALDQMGISRAGLSVDYLIFSTGAGICDLARDEVILSHSLSKSDVLEITGYFDDIGRDYMVQDAIPRTEHFIYRTHGLENPDFNRRIEFYPSLGRAMGKGEALFDAATEVLSIIPGGIAATEFKRIQQDLSKFSVILATSPLDHKSAWVEVFPRAVSKSRSAEWLARKLGVLKANVVAVGNDYNDLDLLSWAGQGFLVENGPEDMKGRFRVVGSNNHCGVSQAVRAAALPA
ncbi:MAG: HAD family phosphatase [Desulfobacter sp.]|nr:MAG: HAD family phosphatase [Desulfobacter sp.]